MLNRALRLPTRAFVQVRSPRGAFDATLGNLSAAGARLVGIPERTIIVGDWIGIHCVGQNYSAEVRWHFDDTCGLMFEEPLSEYQIMTILGSRVAL
ncbi:hypothetical protein [Pararhodobacter zhoushanensis]|jgi:hypothetical protein|uniref:PilZ domain-containing protein n=1 Tax=Pararhodobacter zhoushanensis TaxID=2479545 RepID=A0ABT3GW68_9RHOB|nr:hypothetical protein [Pararhodobacter zhoushanensis]MCW1931777.1 hypothetical protein [Pararhodobacter zhoushanensis]